MCKPSVDDRGLLAPRIHEEAMVACRCMHSMQQTRSSSNHDPDRHRRSCFNRVSGAGLGDKLCLAFGRKKIFLTVFILGIWLLPVHDIRPGTIFDLKFEPMAAILENGCYFETTNARCLLVVLIENSDDFEHLLFWEFACYPFTQLGQGEFLICNMRL